MLVILALIILVIFDICVIHEIAQMERELDHFKFLQVWYDSQRRKENKEVHDEN